MYVHIRGYVAALRRPDKSKLFRTDQRTEARTAAQDHLVLQVERKRERETLRAPTHAWPRRTL